MVEKQHGVITGNISRYFSSANAHTRKDEQGTIEEVRHGRVLIHGRHSPIRNSTLSPP